MSEEKQDFLRRWSRLKREAAVPSPVRTVDDEKPVALPPLDSLSFESDFKAFMHSKVEQSVKRAALKKLFSDPHFNVMDGLDTYIDDYTKSEPISDELLARIEEVRDRLLAPGKEKERLAEEAKAAQAEEAAEEEKATQDEATSEIAQDHVDPAQDPKAL
jgi:hypothetical protein